MIFRVKCRVNRIECYFQNTAKCSAHKASLFDQILFNPENRIKSDRCKEMNRNNEKRSKCIYPLVSFSSSSFALPLHRFYIEIQFNAPIHAHITFTNQFIFTRLLLSHFWILENSIKPLAEYQMIHRLWYVVHCPLAGSAF